MTDAVAMYAAGASSASVAGRLGMSHVSVLNWAVRAGVEVRCKGYTHRFTESIMSEAVKAYADGATGDAVALTFGVSPVTICRWVRAAGVAVRPRGRPAPRDSRNEAP